MKHTVTFEIDTLALENYTSQYLAALWHIAQANPANVGDCDAVTLAEAVGREIILRWLASVPPLLWNHQVADLAMAAKGGAA